MEKIGYVILGLIGLRFLVQALTEGSDRQKRWIIGAITISAFVWWWWGLVQVMEALLVYTFVTILVTSLKIDRAKIRRAYLRMLVSYKKRTAPEELYQDEGTPAPFLECDPEEAREAYEDLMIQYDPRNGYELKAVQAVMESYDAYRDVVKHHRRLQ